MKRERIEEEGSRTPSPRSVRKYIPYAIRLTLNIIKGDFRGLRGLSEDLRSQVSDVAGRHSGRGTEEKQVSGTISECANWLNSLVGQGKNPAEVVKRKRSRD